MNINIIKKTATDAREKTQCSFRKVGIEGVSWLAAFWSYSVNKSILWAIFHWLCGPVYVAYRLVHSFPAFFK